MRKNLIRFGWFEIIYGIKVKNGQFEEPPANMGLKAGGFPFSRPIKA
jgi:hypothetical protein